MTTTQKEPMLDIGDRVESIPRRKREAVRRGTVAEVNVKPFCPRVWRKDSPETYTQVLVWFDGEPEVCSFTPSYLRLIEDGSEKMDNVDREVVLAEMRQDRREKFRVTVEPRTVGAFEPGEITLSVTKNGNQWSSMTLTPSERLAVIAALRAAEDPKPLPTIEEMRGRYPDFTGSLSSEEYVRRNREG